MTKTELADLLNEACERSEVAREKGAHAVVKQGRIFYYDRYDARIGGGLRKISFATILGHLWGEDMRRIRAAYASAKAFC